MNANLFTTNLQKYYLNSGKFPFFHSQHTIILYTYNCFFATSRRRPKQQRNSIGAKLPKTDTSLKIPLMPPTHHKNLVAGIDTSDMHPSVEISTKNGK